MRWYCVHPSLPLQAELRIRVAPDCNAAECARIPQGRAVAACSPVFQMPNNDIDAKPISWLQVAYQDAVSGETDGGFVMATLPDGTALVVPWEVTNYCGCCEIMDSAALLLDGPHVGARSVGSVQNVKFLYCTVEEGEKRIRIFHPEFESVWIDKKDLQIVCTRLKHQQCKIPHTFFELTEALPDEAQIAIRNFPSQKAQTVGLLSRGETLEVVVRGGNWLQIAGGNVDKAWIMWRTDALELLQEAYDVRSDACEEITPNVNADIEAVAVAASADERPICPARCEVGVETAVSVGAVDDGDAAVDADEEITPNVNADIEAVAVAASADERPICPARCEVGVETAVSVGAVDDGDAAVDADEEITPNVNADIEAVAVAASADERPICPARCEVGVETAVSVGAVDDGDAAVDADEEITPNVNADIEAVAVAASADERPICPARCEVGVETAVSVGAVDDGDAAVDADEEITPNVNADIEAVAVAASADERPICPARCEVGVETAVSVGAVDDGDAAVDADEEITPNVNADIEAVAVAASADERPICPARCEVGVETAVSVGAVDDGDAAVDADEEITPNVNADIEAVAVAASADERPICPARCEVGVETAVSVGAVDDGDAAVDADEEITPNVNADIEAVAVAASADERPICPARCEVGVETAVSVGAVDDGDAAVDADEEITPNVNADIEAVAVAASADERPICPARCEVGVETAVSVGAVDDGDAAVDADEEITPNVNADIEAVAVAASADERPICPARCEVGVETAVSVGAVDDGDAAVDADEEITPNVNADIEAVAVAASADERPICPARCEVGVETAVSVGAVDDGDAAVDADEEITPNVNADIEAVAVAASADERPICPARCEVGVETAVSVGAVDDGDAAVDADEEITPNVNADIEAVAVAASADERPICPARCEVGVETAVSVGAVDDGDAAVDADEEITPNVNADIEAVAVAASADERPICPARCEVGVETAVSVGAVDDGDAAVDADEEITPNVNADIEAVAVAASADERPICPARCEVGVETAVSVGAVDDGDAAVDADEEITPNVNADIEAVAVAASADERPICPARCEVGVETAVSVGAVDDGDAAVDADEEITPNVNADIEAVAVAASADERPICPARCEVGVETAVSVGAVDDGDAAADADEEITPNVNADIEAVAVAASADERPICPAKCDIEEVVDELIKVLAATGADFDVRDVMKDFAAKYAVAPEMYGAVGRTSGKSGSVSEWDAGDFAVLGNLDDVFYPVDEIIVGITSEEDTENSWKDTMSQEKGHLAFDSDNVTSFTFDPQVKSNFAEPDNPASASFLQEFGVIKYCERKKALYPASDRLSHAIFNADQDDADLLFEAFVGDDPLSEEWFHDVASKSFVPTLHVASRPVLKLPLKSTYSLIMGGAAAEAILESELLDDDDGNYDLVSSFKYPLSIRSRAFPLRPSPRQGQSASEDRNPEALQATQLAVPLAGVSTTSRLRVDHRNFIGGPNSIAKPSGTLVRPQSLIHTRAPTSSVPKSVESSGLRTSFGFRRPSSFQKR